MGSYIDTPILVVRAYASAAVTEGYFVNAGDTGFAGSASAASTALSGVAVATASASSWFPLMIIGVVYASPMAAVYAGNLVIFGDTAGRVTPAADTNLCAKYVGTCLDFAADSSTSRNTRVFINLIGKAQDSANNHW